MGIASGDFSVAQVLDQKKRLVATWRGRVHPDHFASILFALGDYYNEAHIIVENNSHGILTCTGLSRISLTERLPRNPVDKIPSVKP